MKLLLTSSGITNKSIHSALVDLLGKPIAESNALFIPTAIYPFAQGARMAWQAMCGKPGAPLTRLGWRSLGLLELNVLPGIDKKNWVPMLQETDALLVWGGDVLYLVHWMQHSGLEELLPSLLSKMVYVGVSAGSMAATGTIGETYHGSPGSNERTITSEDIVFSTPEGEISSLFVTARGMGLVDFSLIPHFEHKDHRDACGANAEKWASKLTVPVYAIDDATAIKVTGDTVEVVSEGKWRLFNDK